MKTYFQSRRLRRQCLALDKRRSPIIPCVHTYSYEVYVYKMCFQMVTLLDSDGGKNDVLRQKRRQEKQFVYDIAFGEDLSQVST